LPDGQISAVLVNFSVQPPSQKYFGFSEPKSVLQLPPSCPERGALRNVINAGQDAVDAGGAFDERR
jgi:hypothetical protein